MKLVKKCKNCNKNFSKKYNTSMRSWLSSGTKYCSVSCFHVYRRAEIQCVICGKKLIVKRCQKNHIKTCSKKCCKENKKRRFVKFRTGRPWSEEWRKAQSGRIKRAYKEGRMKHMKSVWKQAGPRWSGDNNPRWSEIIRHHSSRGYVFVKDDRGIRRVEHRVVAERLLGRRLKQTEVIHHINEKKNDNRPENLYLFPSDYFHKQHHGYVPTPLLKSNLIAN